MGLMATVTRRVVAFRHRPARLTGEVAGAGEVGALF
jgi:hypothetical protein